MIQNSTSSAELQPRKPDPGVCPCAECVARRAAVERELEIVLAFARYSRASVALLKQ